MPFLRLAIYQPSAHYRIPFTVVRRHTYPIPPYSTVIGFLCNVCGINDQNHELYRIIKELKISIAGRFVTKTTEMLWFRNLEKEKHTKLYGYSTNRERNGQIGHPGGQAPVWIDVLEDVDLIIHLYHHEIEKLKDHLESPEKRLQVMHLGRAEDLIVYKDIQIAREDDFEYKRCDGNYRYFFWIPERIFNPVGESINWEDFEGITYALTTFSKVEGYEQHFNHTSKRYYERIKAKLNDGRIVQAKALFDKKLGLPVFLMETKLRDIK